MTLLEQVQANLGHYPDNLGLEFTEASADRVVATWTAGPLVHQPFGIVHGGAHCTVVETLGSIAGAIWNAENGVVVGVSNSTDFYRAATTGTMTSTATPLHRGRSQQVWVVETRDDDDRLVARGQLRLQNLPAKPGREPLRLKED